MVEFTLGDMLRFLPCMHVYHKDCIDDWLMRSFTCPSCMEPVDAALLTTYETSWSTWMQWAINCFSSKPHQTHIPLRGSSITHVSLRSKIDETVQIVSLNEKKKEKDAYESNCDEIVLVCSDVLHVIEMWKEVAVTCTLSASWWRNDNACWEVCMGWTQTITLTF